METHLEHDLFQENPTDAIIGFAYVHFQSHLSELVACFPLHMVNELESHDNIIRNGAAFHKSLLCFWNQFGKNYFQMIS